MTDLEHTTQQLKELDIRDVLRCLGIPYKEQYNRVVFSLRNEKNPSCSAVLKGSFWVWRDFGDDNLRGSVIDLYAIVKNLSFYEAVKEMENIFLKGNTTQTAKTPLQSIENKASVKVIAVMDRFLDKQVEYLKNRCVYPPVPQLKPVIYTINGNKRYGIGIETLSDGWVIRQTIDKAINGEVNRYLFVGKADISYWLGSNNKVVVVEGMFDALSVRKLEKEKNNIIILNSTANWRKAIDFIRSEGFKNVILALDMDKAGIETMLKMKKELSNAKVWKYGAKDLNEYLCREKRIELEKRA
jgi:5S rRNA maturation endonuclease (ribonuclease M5)